MYYSCYIDCIWHSFALTFRRRDEISVLFIVHADKTLISVFYRQFQYSVIDFLWLLCQFMTTCESRTTNLLCTLDSCKLTREDKKGNSLELWLECIDRFFLSWTMKKVRPFEISHYIFQRDSPRRYFGNSYAIFIIVHPYCSVLPNNIYCRNCHKDE